MLYEDTEKAKKGVNDNAFIPIASSLEWGDIEILVFKTFHLLRLIT